MGPRCSPARKLHRFLTGISHGEAVHDTADMPQIKIGADGGDLNGRWGHNQLDALGLGLFCMVRYCDSGPQLDSVLKAATLITAYLARVDFTRLQCNGHWEEAGPNGKGSILTSSLGCIVHGMKSLRRWIDGSADRARQLDDYLRGLDCTVNGFGESLRTVRDDGELIFSFARSDDRAAISKGTATIRERYVDGDWVETFDDPLGRRRGSDLALSTLALLELAVPPGERITSRNELTGLVAQLERDLKGPVGYHRYIGDGWIAAYPNADGPDPAPRMKVGLDIVNRDCMTPGTSPEWTLGNGVMAHLHGRLFLETGDVRYRDKASEHMGRLAGNISPDPEHPGRFEITELFMHVREDHLYRYAPNGLDLNWSHAYAELAANTMRDVVVADTQLKQSRRASSP